MSEAGMWRGAAVAALGALLLTWPGGGARGDDVCAADLKRYCSDAAPLDAVKCLEANRNMLAPACQERLEAVMVSLEVSRQDCKPDAFAYCRHAGAGRDMVRCLAAQQGRLSPRCQAVFDQWASREREVMGACAMDGKLLCADVAPVPGATLGCLVASGKEVSAACRDALLRR